MSEIRLQDMGYVPWCRYDWHGEWVSLDGAPAAEFAIADVAEVIAYWVSDDDEWDGYFAGIVRLNSGVYASWEGTFGPTGHGFCCDAYGGDTDVCFSHDLATALNHLSERSREGLSLPATPPR